MAATTLISSWLQRVSKAVLLLKWTVRLPVAGQLQLPEACTATEVDYTM